MHLKTNIGVVVSHVRRHSDSIFKVKVMVTVRFTHIGLNLSGSCSGERWNVLVVSKYRYVVVWSAARR